jgi:hypothetical protein
MKKLNQPLSKEYMPLKLYLDDLNEIEGIVKESTATMELEADGFQFASVEEMAHKLRDRSITGVKLTISQPYSTIELERLWAKLYVSSSETLGAGLFHKLDHVLAQARRPLWFLYSYYFVSPLGSLAGIMILKSLWALGIGPIGWALWVFFVRSRRHSLVIIVARKGIGSFWTRKKDDIILVGMGAFIGAILGVIGTLLISYLSK